MTRTRIGPLVVGAANAVAVISWVLWSRIDHGSAPADTTTLLLVFGALVVGEVWRTSSNSRPIAPLSTASSMGLALAPLEVGTRPLGAAQALVIAAAAMGLGLVIRVIVGWGAGGVDAAARLLGMGVTVGASRAVTIGATPILGWVQDPDTPRWLAAAALVVLSTAGVFVELAAWTALSWDRRIPIGRMIEEDVLRAGGLGSAMTAAGPLIALGVPMVQSWAIPIVLFPLSVAMLALRRREATEATYRETVIALSRLTDDTGHTRPGHARRVADLAMAMARELQQPERDVARLEEAALLHDVGQVTLPVPIPGGATVLADPDSQRRIVTDSVRILERAGVSAAVGQTITASVEQFRVMREWGQAIPLSARILKVANAYDDLTGGNPASAARSGAIERMNLGLGYEYDPVCVATLAHVTKAPPG